MALPDKKSIAPGETLVLYDIPSRSPNRPWSPNTWKIPPGSPNASSEKARLALLHKKITFTTRWIEYPDIDPTLRAAGVPPNDPSVAPWPYTLPTVFLPAPAEYVMGSSAIAGWLEQRFPSFPALHVDAPLVQRVDKVFADLLQVTDSLYLHGVPAQLLNPRSEEYFRRDRERILGTEIEKYATEQRRLASIGNAAPYVVRLADMLRGDDTGPFLMGRTVGYADFIIVAWMVFWERLHILEDLIEVDRVPLRRLFEACIPWVRVVEHW